MGTLFWLLDRFVLNRTHVIYDLEITDSKAALAAQTGGWVVSRRPYSTEQAVEFLLEQRERYGFSYLQIQATQMENLAPVVARLVGKY